MRWRFIDPKNESEAAARAKTVAAIDAWWKAFANQAPEIARVFTRESEMDLPEFMMENLELICPGLMWEFGPGPGGAGHSLVITPEAKRHLRPLVDAMLKRAPKLEGWSFDSYRTPCSMDLAIQAILGRTGQDITGAGFEASIGAGHRVDLTYQMPPSFKGSNDEAREAAFVATEVILGEEVLDTWIGQIQGKRPVGMIGKLLRGFQPDKSKPLEQLAGTVEALIDAIKEQLPKEPTYMRNRVDGPELRDGMHSMLKLNVDPDPAAQDYPGISDMIVAVTEDAEVWRAMHTGGMKCVRYSRHGETFCYLKLDGTQIEGESMSRHDLMEALDRALIPAGKGCTIGGGTGVRYSYIDLALVDFENAWPIVVDVMRKEKLGSRSWLLFCEPELADEWIGMYDQTPEPPKES